MAHFDKWQPVFQHNDALERAVKEDAEKHGWKFWEENKDRVIFRFLFWTVTVEDLFEIFVDLFGEKVDA